MSSLNGMVRVKSYVCAVRMCVAPSPPQARSGLCAFVVSAGNANALCEFTAARREEDDHVPPDMAPKGWEHAKVPEQGNEGGTGDE